jgi:hypothetical protein
LHNKSLTFDTKSAINLLAEVLIGKHFTNAVVDTETSGLSATVDATLLDVLSSAAAFSVDVLFTFDVHVGVLDPGHNLFIGTHIGAEAIHSSSNKTLLDEFHGVLAGNALEFSLGKRARVNFDSTFATTERNISNSEFESHQTSEGLNFLQIDMVGVTSTTLAGKLVSWVLGSVAGNSVEVTVIAAQGDVEADHRLARLDVVQVLGVNTRLGGSRVIEQLHLFKETGLLVFVKTGASRSSDVSGESTALRLEQRCLLEVLDALHIVFCLVYDKNYVEICKRW